MNLARVAALARKEWSEILRDRMFFALAFVLPALLMIVFGYGSGQPLEHVPLAVVDHDRTATSRRYAERFAGTVYFDLAGVVGSEREAAERLSRGEVRVVMVIPEEFERRLLAGRSAAVQTWVDGSWSNSTPPRSIQSYVEAIDAAATAELQAGVVSRRLGIPVERADALLRPVRLQVRYLYNPQLRTVWSTAPSMVMFIHLFVAPLLMALGVVREKESGSILNIYSSTVTRAEFVAGKLLPSVAIGCANGVVLWVLAVGWFGAPFHGSLLLFALATLLYAIATPGIGLVISLVVRTQATAMIVTVALAVLIGTQYSGMYIPVDAMPPVSWVIAHLFPSMYFHDVIQGIFLKGMGAAMLWRELAALALFAAAFPALAWLLFHKRRRA
ncbi:ABC transporter permease [Anaeromyxobacter oryzae]|uniref:ABC transmembrane type-2 domain-containing protein n=1 Tax=Anaeromyxobacter oryzae TaxID=2918170 RepID=A0ABM7WQC6_9BACT|nr:ABC transporter permease [Anaeromyxobacter oryzae]BDG01667.1 hypothetical protein AMOR_06630 [Anaeromyxobacter oryzae]